MGEPCSPPPGYGPRVYPAPRHVHVDVDDGYHGGSMDKRSSIIIAVIVGVLLVGALVICACTGVFKGLGSGRRSSSYDSPTVYSGSSGGYSSGYSRPDNYTVRTKHDSGWKQNGYVDPTRSADARVSTYGPKHVQKYQDPVTGQWRKRTVQNKTDQDVWAP